MNARTVIPVARILALAWALSAASNVSAQVYYDSSPGNGSVHVGVTNFLMTPDALDPIRATIAKTKAHTVVEIFVAVTGAFGPEERPIIAMAANGRSPNGLWDSTYQSNCDVAAYDACTLNALFLLDVDQAEEAFPGLYANRPLQLETYLVDNNANNPDLAYVDVTISARMRRK